MLLTVQCSEHMGFDLTTPWPGEEATLFGNYRLEQQILGCAVRPHGKTDRRLGAERTRPLRIPTLLASGAWDAVTPPAYAEDATAYRPGRVGLSISVLGSMRSRKRRPS